MSQRLLVWNLGEDVWVQQEDGSYRSAYVDGRGHKGDDWYDVVYHDAPGRYDPVHASQIRKTKPEEQVV